MFLILELKYTVTLSFDNHCQKNLKKINNSYNIVRA